MLPRIDVSFASVDMSYDELVEIFLEEQYSRLPVYEESKDNVIGILNLKDLFFYRETHRNEAFDIYKSCGRTVLVKNDGKTDRVIAHLLH